MQNQHTQIKSFSIYQKTKQNKTKKQAEKKNQENNPIHNSLK
jgi:hypothetical protein